MFSRNSKSVVDGVSVPERPSAGTIPLHVPADGLDQVPASARSEIQHLVDILAAQFVSTSEFIDWTSAARRHPTDGVACDHRVIDNAYNHATYNKDVSRRGPTRYLGIESS